MAGDNEWDCIVIGAGPAGLTAAHYLRRFHRSVRVLEDGESRARYIPRSHNYPGFPHGVAGDELLHRMQAQLAAVHGVVSRQAVTALAAVPSGFEVAAGGEVMRARKVLLATGVRDIEPALDGLDAVRARGLLRQCPICDGFEYTGRRIGVIGAGWHGVREVQFLRTFSADIVYLPYDSQLSDDMRKELVSCGIAELPAGPQRVACGATGGVTVQTEDGQAHHVDVLYAALGSAPRSELAQAVGANVDGNRNIEIDAHCRTSVAHLFAAGDVAVGLDQLAVAIGHAAIAATAMHNELRSAG